MPALTLITVCKGRLSHLKQSLASFVAQDRTEVIVVDYDCPENTSEYVASAAPDVKVVKVEGRPNFNNWEARNIGAQQASSDLVAFVDADVILSHDFADWAIENVHSDVYGKMPSAMEQQLHGNEKLTPSSNRLEGLLVVERATFIEMGGYDDLLEGWGAGGDLDLRDRLAMHDKQPLNMPETLVDRTIEHSMDDRTRFHKMTVSNSHLVGLLYRTSKNSLMRLFAKDITLEERQRLYDLSKRAAANSPARKLAAMDLLVLSNEVPGANYKIEQTITTKVSWGAQAGFPEPGSQS